MTIHAATTTAIIALATLCSPLTANPWGKDADLTSYHPNAPEKCCVANTRGPISMLSQVLIRFHQTVISPADGPRSHFTPSSSQYGLESIRRYGFLRGFAMACDRLMRENDEDWVYRTKLRADGKLIKWDPVP